MNRRPAFLTILALAACSSANDAASDSVALQASRGSDSATVATAAGETTGFDTPESVRWDPELDVYYVSNINGNPGAADGNGYISRVHPDSLSTPTRLIEGGRNGVTLNAPKGMAIQGDTLWVADVTVVRAFDRRTGAPIAAIDLAPQNAVFLNDVAVGIDGIYVTDTNIRFGSDGSMSNPGVDRIFRISGRTASAVAEGDSLSRPNGIAWDSSGTRFVLASFGPGGIMTWRPGDPAPRRLAAGPGQYDGVEVLGDGRIVVSSWADSAVHVVDRNGGMRRIVTGVAAPADIGVDTKRNLLLVPLFNDGKVTYWRF